MYLFGVRTLFSATDNVTRQSYFFQALIHLSQAKQKSLGRVVQSWVKLTQG